MSRVKCCVFISSPGDVGQERLIASRVLERLSGEFSGRLHIDPVLWEHEPLRATQHFQEQLVLPSETDLVICILWSRLGTRLPEGYVKPDGTSYASGTEWEFEEAANAFRAKGTPDLLVYRKTGQVMIPLEGEEEVLERLRQQRALQGFIDRWFGNPHDGFKAAFHAFQSAADFEALLEIHVRRWLEERLRKMGDGSGEQDVEPIWHKSPFRGLSAFEYEHAPIFFGRTSAIAGVKEALVRQAARGKPFVLVLGMSGGGKSSVIKAGVLPTLTQPGVVDGVGLWRWSVFRPGNSAGDLCDGLATALLWPKCLPELTQQGYDTTELAALLREAPQRVVAPLRGVLNQISEATRVAENLSHAPVSRVALAMDQLEEIFSLPVFTQQHRVAFLAALSALVKSGLVWTMATMRSDFYPRCADLPDLVDLKEGEGQYDLLPPTFAETRQMIVAPARAAALKFDTDAATNTALDVVLHEASAQDPRSLPLLEFTLDELYNRRTQSGVLPFSAYREMGGLEGALANRAEETFTQLDPAVQQVLPQLMRMLVTLRGGANDQFTASRVALSDVTANPQLKELVDAFVRTRLLVTDRAADGAAVVGVAHEALLTRWPRLAELLKGDREFLRIRTHVAEAAARWRSEDRHADFLLAPGKPLVEAEDMMANYGSEVDRETATFVDASSRSAQAARRRKRNLAIAVAGAFMLTALTFGTVSFASYLRASAAAIRASEAAENERIARGDAEKALDASEKAEALAKQRQQEAEKAAQAEAKAKQESDRLRVQAEKDYDSALKSQIILADRDFYEGDLAGARKLLEQFPEDRRRWEWNYVNRLCNDNRLVLKHNNFVFDAAFSPDGRKLLTVSGELSSGNFGEITVWDAQYGKKLFTFPGHKSTVYDAIWHPAGDRIISTSSSADEVLVWDANTGAIRQKFSLRGATAMAMPREGNMLAIGGSAIGNGDDERAEILLVDIETGDELGRLPGHHGDITSLSFSKDGKRLASGGQDRVAKAWDVENRKQVSEFTGDVNEVWTIDLTPDGKKIVSGGNGHTVYVWDFDTGQELLRLNGHKSSVTRAKFNSGGSEIATCGWDQLVKIWNATTGQEKYTIRGHENWVTAVDFSPSDGSLVSTSWDKTARVWDLNLASLREVEIGTGVSLDFKTDLGKEVSTIITIPVEDVAVHPSEASLAVATFMGCYVRPLGAHLPPRTLDEGAERICYSADGNWIAAPKDDRKSAIVLWQGENDPDEVPLQSGWANDVAFSPTQYRLAAALTTGVALIDAPSATVIWNVPYQASAGKSIAWKHDGTQLASGHFDGQVVLWSSDGKELKILSGLEFPINGVAFSPNGELIAAGSGLYDQPGEIGIWNVETGQLLHKLKGHSGSISCVLFSRDGERLFSGSNDRTIRLWDVKTGQEALILRGHGREVSSISLSKDGNKLYSSSKDGTIIKWDSSPVPTTTEAPAAFESDIPGAILE